MREKKRRERERGDLVLEQVWFPLDQRPGIGLFVQAERPKGEQGQPDVAPPNLAAMEGISAAVLHSLTPPVPVPFLHPFFPPNPQEQSPNASSKLFTDLHCLCAIHKSRVKSSCQSPWPDCLNHVIDMSFIGQSKLVH